MEDNKENASGKNSDASGNEEKEKENNSVAYDTYSRTLSEAKKEKSKRRELEQELNAMKAREEAEKKAKLEEEGKHKELNAELRKEVDTEKEKNINMQNRINNSFKIQAFKDALPSKLGNEDFLSFVKLDKIEIDESNIINAESVKVEVDRFMSQYPQLIQNDGDELPSDGPRDLNSNLITTEEWKALPLKEQRARMQEYRKAEAIRDKQKS